MDRMMLILLFVVASVFTYSYLANKFIKNKLWLFLPTFLGVLCFIYLFITYKTKIHEGFGDLAIIISGIIVSTFILTNIFSSIFLIYKNKNK